MWSRPAAPPCRRSSAFAKTVWCRQGLSRWSIGTRAGPKPSRPKGCPSLRSTTAATSWANDLKRGLGRQAALLFSIASLGCAHRAASGSDVNTAYTRAVRSWTSGAEIYHFADERAHFTATVESRVFREQRVRERSRELGWPAEVELAEFEKEFRAN